MIRCVLSQLKPLELYILSFEIAFFKAKNAPRALSYTLCPCGSSAFNWAKAKYFLPHLVVPVKHRRFIVIYVANIVLSRY